MVWMAVLYSLRRPLKPPLAALRTLRRRARPGTTVFARGMGLYLLLRGRCGRGPRAERCVVVRVNAFRAVRGPAAPRRRPPGPCRWGGACARGCFGIVRGG